MRTTIDLPDELFREAKTLAVQQRTTLKNLITQFILSGLGAESSESVPSKRRTPPPIAIHRIPGQSPSLALTNRQLSAALDAEDVHAIRKTDSQIRTEGSL
jgi:hypothetical protein